MLHVCLHVLAAGLVRGRGECLELVGQAVGGGVAEGVAQEGAYEVGEGVGAVHEDPEAGEVVWASEDAAEGVEHDTD